MAITAGRGRMAPRGSLGELLMGGTLGWLGKLKHAPPGCVPIHGDTGEKRVHTSGNAARMSACATNTARYTPTDKATDKATDTGTDTGTGRAMNTGTN